MEVGKIFKSNNYGDVVIQEYNGTKNVVVKWINTGHVQRFQSDAIRKGLIVDGSIRAAARKEKDDRSKARAVRIESNQKQKAIAAERAAVLRERAEARKLTKVLRALAAQEHKQEILSRPTKFLEVEEFVLDLTRPRKGVLDIDFKDRDGKWVLRYKYKDQFVQTRLGRLHNNVTQRCKLGGSLQRYNKAYNGATMSEAFKDPQKFCDWVVQQPGWGLGYSLDKDLLSKGGKHYSEETCVFLPAVLNTLLIPHETNFRKDSYGQFTVKTSIQRKDILLGKFATVEEAHKVYMEYRNKYLMKVVEAYKANISSAAYDALTKLLS